MKQVLTIMVISGVLLISGCDNKSSSNYKQEAEASIEIARIQAKADIEIARIHSQCKGGE